MNTKRLKKINNLYGLQAYKKYLRKKLYIRERLMNKHFKDFRSDFSAEYLAKETLKGLKLEGGFWNFLPKLFSGESMKKLFIPLFSGLSAAITSSFLYKEKKKNASKNENYYGNDQMFI